MNSSEPEGWSGSGEYKLITDDNDDSSSSSVDYSSDDEYFISSTIHKNKQKYKKILTEEDLLPE